MRRSALSNQTLLRSRVRRGENPSGGSLLPPNILLKSSCRASLFFSRSLSRCISIAPPAARNRGECTGLALESCHRLCRSTVRHLAFPLRPPPRVIVAALRRGISDILRSSAAGRFDKVSPACSNGSDCETVRLPSPFLPATAQCDPHALFQRYAA